LKIFNPLQIGCNYGLKIFNPLQFGCNQVVKNFNPYTSSSFTNFMQNQDQLLRILLPNQPKNVILTNVLAPNLPQQLLMNDHHKSKTELIEELNNLRQALTHISAEFERIKTSDPVKETITHDRILVDQELEESREKYRGLSKAAFESIFISEKGVCIEQNQSAEIRLIRIYKWSEKRENIAGQKFLVVPTFHNSQNR
jgi:hypothetical protein